MDEVSKVVAEPAGITKLRSELPRAAMKDVFWLSRDEAQYLLDCADRLSRAQQEAEPVAKLHRDGYWTHDPGRDPFDRFGPNANSGAIEVYTAPQPCIDLTALKDLAFRWNLQSDPYHGKCADELLALIAEQEARNG